MYLQCPETMKSNFYLRQGGYVFVFVYLSVSKVTGQKCVGGRGSAGELTALPRLPSWKRKEKERRGGEEGKEGRKVVGRGKSKCHGSHSVLSLNEIVGTFTHFTLNEAFHFTYANQDQVSTSLMIINTIYDLCLQSVS